MPDLLTRFVLKSLKWRKSQKAPRAEPTLYVIDPGCTAGFGHHRTINQIIYDECAKQNEALEIYTGRMDTPETLGFLPRAIFSDVVYVGIPDTAVETQAKIDHLNGQILKELLQTLPALKERDRVVVHTASVTMLQALAYWLELNGKPGMIVSIVMMLTPYSNPGRKTISAESLAVLDACYRASFDALRALPIQLKIFAETKEMAATYEAIAGAPVDISPIPIEFHHHNDATNREELQAEETGPVFLFAGDSRPEKGILLMSDAIALYYERGGKGGFIIQCGEPPEDQSPKARAIAELQALAPQVTLVTDSFTGPDYFNFLDRGDILLAPYDPTHYGTIRPSRVLLEGLGVGKPVITSAGTWMEAMLKGLDRPCGTIMTAFEAEALCNAMLEAERRQSELSRNAQQIAARIRDTHNQARYLEAILQRPVAQATPQD